MEDAHVREQAGLNKALLALEAFSKLSVTQADAEVGLSFLTITAAHIVRINSLEPPEAPEEPESWEPSFNNRLLAWATQDSLDAFVNNVESRVRREASCLTGRQLETLSGRQRPIVAATCPVYKTDLHGKGGYVGRRAHACCCCRVLEGPSQTVHRSSSGAEIFCLFR